MRLLPNANGEIDLALTTSGQLAIEDSLNSAVIISLLSDRRADPSDALPYLDNNPGPIPPDRKGWCGDALSEIPGDRIGSRLWILRRSKQTPQTLQAAISYAQEALQWLIDDGEAAAVNVTAAWTARGQMNMSVAITLPDGTIYSTNVITGGAYVI